MSIGGNQGWSQELVEIVAPIWVTHKVVAALGADEEKSRPLERLEILPPGDTPQPAHTSTATRWTPMNSGGASSAL